MSKVDMATLMRYFRNFSMKNFLMRPLECFFIIFTRMQNMKFNNSMAKSLLWFFNFPKWRATSRSALIFFFNFFYHPSTNRVFWHLIFSKQEMRNSLPSKNLRDSIVFMEFSKMDIYTDGGGTARVLMGVKEKNILAL